MARRFVFPLLAALLGLAGGAQADADFPSRPITVIVTFPPGGGTDLLARKLGGALQRDLGQPVVIENRPGASGNIGARAVAEAKPDGYTLLMVNSSFAINPGVFGKLDFSPEQDFAAVINVAFVPSVIVVPAASPLNTLDAVLRSNLPENPLPYASCGNGTPQHLAAELLRARSNAAMQQVPYKGCGPALSDVLAGHVPLGVVTASSAFPFLQSGKLHALAVSAAERSPLMPDVPTVAEQGWPGYDLDQWHGLLAPAATPPAVISRLNQALSAIMARPAMRAELLKLGFNPVASTPQAFQALVLADIQRFGQLTRRMGLHAD
ncbi:tripartite tricarboxylate transporter substrate binding protein [Bordetella avium]|uniref:Exported protein n=1 Tax=Bordetella avium (strain 197N) TaxID=360910 RepID=Q2KV48_BORA1|nr:tripartite tricarboxylate transporter substrate binding protein [Bordetella avium]AZY50293.1 tripartite tricarboxylate transporter substrate binding protein [Bordetella avium]AZY53687.1 tripartite tricarboxylate transporter substrate binding protein [Bordetella avium]RIQ15539.1 tripartite tricarboxylate transporter substrate binding protein [Bordetella avium]RIQ34235.1 tripartite tricarboxylate transporter substrate binding protein [Bordetella avium]RIQ38351.1 tripartite tricarboxylate tran